MRPALPAWLLLAATLAAAPTPYVDKKSAVADESWMNARVKEGEVLQSGQQLDPEGTLIDVSGRLLAIEFDHVPIRVLQTRDHVGRRLADTGNR